MGHVGSVHVWFGLLQYMAGGFAQLWFYSRRCVLGVRGAIWQWTITIPAKPAENLRNVRLAEQSMLIDLDLPS